jgi:hypothetical protein
LKRVVVVNKGLLGEKQNSQHISKGKAQEERASKRKGETYHKKSPDGIVQEDDGSSREHGEADELVELECRKLGEVSKLLKSNGGPIGQERNCTRGLTIFILF